MAISDVTNTLVNMVPVAVGVGLLDRASRLAEKRSKTKAKRKLDDKPPARNVQFLKGQPRKTEGQTLAHDLIEMDDMDKGKAYRPAHLHALKAEKKGLQILKTHDDGDLTVKAGGRTFLVATDKTVFRKIGTHHKHKMSHDKGRLRSVKFGPMYHTKVNGGTLLTRFPISRHRRRRSR